MSFSITEAQVLQFSSNVFHLSQQKGSRLKDCVRNERQKGKAEFFERIGKVTAQKKVSRHSDTPLIDTPHSRRKVTLSDYEHADLVDKADEVKILIDPIGRYVEAFSYAFGRAKDNEIIDAADGLAYAGEDGNTAVAHPNSQKIAAVSGGFGSNLNVPALTHAKAILDGNEVDPAIRRYLAVTSSQIQSMLAQTSVTSIDFNTVRALVQGQIDTFVGFMFKMTELLDLQVGTLLFDATTGSQDGGGSVDADGYRKCLAWAEDGLVLSTGMDITTDVGPRRDKSMSMQAFMAMSIGSTRLEEEKVVVINTVA